MGACLYIVMGLPTPLSSLSPLPSSLPSSPSLPSPPLVHTAVRHRVSEGPAMCSLYCNEDHDLWVCTVLCQYLSDLVALPLSNLTLTLASPVQRETPPPRRPGPRLQLRGSSFLVSGVDGEVYWVWVGGEV